jgi:cytochrome c-type biogenesis protein CcsB
MTNMDTLWLAPALVCYALSAVIFIAGRLTRTSRASGWAIYLLGAGVIFHALDLTARGFQAGNIPVGNFAQALSFFAWLTALASLLLIVRLQMAVIGAYSVGVVAATLGASAIMMKGGRIVLPASLQSVWLPIHVTLAILGFSMFVLASSVSLVYLAYESQLKAKRPLGPASERPPSLEKLDRINYSLLGWGFALLSLAIITGAIWADATWGHFWSWEPVESWSLTIWILYAALLEARLTVGWRGRRAAALTIVVFLVLVGSFVGVSLIDPGKHGGWFG